MTVLQPPQGPGIAARGSHGHSGCLPLHRASLQAATHASVMRWLQWLWRNVLLLTSLGDRWVTSLLMCQQDMWPGRSPGSRERWSWHPSSLGFSQDNQGRWGDLRPLEMSPQWFAKALLPGKLLRRADLCSLQQGSILLPGRAWHAARAGPAVHAQKL